MAALTPGQAGHLLRTEQVEFFDEHGYLVLRGRVTGKLLARAQEAAEYWIAAGYRAQDTADYGFAERPGGRVMFRVNYLHAKDHPGSLELLGSPAILGIAESLAGADFVPTYESLVFKEAGDGAAVAWHQDAVHERHFRDFNVGVYLDPSRAGAGALRVVPRSQLAAIDACAVAEEFGWDIPGAIEVELEAGDVLVHDVMVVHGSPPVRGCPRRRTLYYAFHPAQQILRHGPWDREFVDARLRLVPLALAAYSKQFPDAAQYEWRAPEAIRPRMTGSATADLRIAHAVHYPGSYCHPGLAASARPGAVQA